MINRLFISLGFVVVLAGCVTLKPTVERIPFPENEYTQLQKEGTATVKGQAFLKTMGGDVKFAAGEEILLNPATSYSNQWYEEYYLKQNPISPGDPRQMEYVRKKIADGSGRFEFKNIPAGEYYVTGMVTWEAPTGHQGALQKQGGLISKKIKVTDGEEVEVILTR
jgi:hypothetical protein